MHIPESVLFAVAMREENAKNNVPPSKDDALSLLVEEMETEGTSDRAPTAESDENVPDDALSRLVREMSDELLVAA